MASTYDHKKIEKKWQERWEKENAFRAEDDSKKNKMYVLDMFPYPSGAGLHVGHVEGYTATDIYSRFKRIQGYSVLHPMGWDAFGLPAENYAIKTGVAPAKTTDDAIKTFRAQIKSLGLSYDWSREIGTHTPEYYKWTQWFFLFLYKNGLAEKRLAKVNWCPKDQTVLANEQTVSETGEKGVCFRCGTKVIQKDLKQWFFKITDFADALYDDLDSVDWPESTKIAQRNWIGRSEGAEIEFQIANTDTKIKVFTTRPDTLFGATYMVLAPEHSAVIALKTQIANWDEVETYIQAAKNKTDLERQEEQKDKTGVEIKSVKAINPATKEEVPIYIADYVLGGYGTGAIMAVPAHDGRDYAFAKKFNIPQREVVVPNIVDRRNPPVIGKKIVERINVHAIVRDPKSGKYVALKWKKFDWTTFPMGGVEEGEDVVAAAMREVKEETGFVNLSLVRVLPGRVRAEYFAAHKDQNRVSYTTAVVFNLKDLEQVAVSPEESDAHEVFWLTDGELDYAHMTHAEVEEWKAQLAGRNFFEGNGVLVDSGNFSGSDSIEAKKKITDAVGGKWVTTYRLRDWLISRQRYWGAPIPVVYDPEGKPHPVPEEHLPWILPTDVEYLPHGTAPLATSKELLERTEKIFGKGWRPEVDTMDTFVCSSWYYFRFADPKNTAEFASKEAIEKWLPVDLYVGGAEHTVLHLMYSRFFTKALKKHGVIGFNEPFTRLRHQGLVLAEDGNKMSKSKGNVINPDDVINRYGADSIRLYEMFMGPLEASKPWNTKNILGVRRFLEQVWKVGVHINKISKLPQGPSADLVAEPVDVRGSAEGPLEYLLNQTINKVTGDLEQLKMNTVVSSLMILLNKINEVGSVSKEKYKIFLQLLAPLAPHITAELWEQFGEKDSIYETVWPVADPAKLTAQSAKVAVQVNGKLRATIDIPSGLGETEVLTLARADQNVAKWLALGKEMKAVYVPGKVLNFVVQVV
jgi:leucyl-tRNA synthetase